MSLLTSGGGTRHPNPDAQALPVDEARRLLEQLRLAAADALVALSVVGMLPSSTDEPLARLRAAIDAVPPATVLVPFGEPDPNGWVVTVAKGRGR